MQLYTYFRSSTSFRLRIALAWKGLAWTPRYVNLPELQHRAPAYLETNPQGLVPTLVDDAGRVFTQSMAMIEYLDERHPEPPLLPGTAEDRWYVRAVSQIIGCEIHPLNNVRVLRYLKSAYGLDDAKVSGDWYPHWIAEGLAGLEKFLLREGRHGRHCLGDAFTMADVCLVPQIYNAKRYDCDLTPYPTVIRLFAAADALDCVQAALPAKQGDAK